MNFLRWNNVLAALVVLAIVSVATVSQASLQLGFTHVSPHNSPFAPSIATQLTVDVYDAVEAENTFGIDMDTAGVLFVFRNTAAIASSISEIYFDNVRVYRN